LCEECGERTRRVLAAIGKQPEQWNDERTFDSDDYPKGPYANGGGEAETPNHCDHCHVFLENPLTSDGEEYFREALARGKGNAEVLAAWADWYSRLIPDDEEGEEDEEQAAA